MGGKSALHSQVGICPVGICPIYRGSSKNNTSLTSCPSLFSRTGSHVESSSMHSEKSKTNSHVKGECNSSLKKGNGGHSCCCSVRAQAESYGIYGYVGECVGRTPLDSGCSLRELCSGICFGIW